MVVLHYGGSSSLNLAQRARVATGLSQRKFAEMLGVSPSVVCRWEAGRPPSGAAHALLLVIVDYPALVAEVLAKSRGGDPSAKPYNPG